MKRCKDCRYYRRDPLRAAAVEARKNAGDKASGPMLRARFGGWCHARESEVHPVMKVPHGRDMVDAVDWCQRWKPRRPG